MLKMGEKTLCCEGERRHSYDFSASGYVNLASPKQFGGGDTKEAVRARSAFLNKGFYQPIADKITELLKRYIGERARVVDAGCGEGYYTAELARSGFSVYGFDISKFAVEAAAKRAKRELQGEKTFFAVASVYTLPIFDATVDAVVNIFAPCVEAEYTRILSDGGVLIVAQAGAEHLLGLKELLYDNVRENDTRADLPKELELLCEERLRYVITLEDNQSITELFAMTPYYWRTSRDDAKKLEKRDSLKTEVDVILSVYRKTVGESDGQT